MKKDYSLEVDIEKTIDELDMIPGVIKNKDVIKNMIIYSKLKERGEINFGNFNIIIHNKSSYNLIGDFLNILSEVLYKGKIAENNNICYLDKILDRGIENMCKLLNIEEGIIVIDEDKMPYKFFEDSDILNIIMKLYKNKLFIFISDSYRDGDLDAKIGTMAMWKMSIDRISEDDKLTYVKNLLNENNITYRHQDLINFCKKEFWKLKNDTFNLIIYCKNLGITKVNNNIIKEIDRNSKESRVNKKFKDEKERENSKTEIEKLIGLNEIKSEVNKIIDYIKINKKRDKMPTLHMCFNGNPGTGKTSIARIIGKIFKEENILKGGDFDEIHGRDLVGKYVGWTAVKVHETIENALGGVLFIDEAYSLYSDRRGGFEDEAIATLIKEMEDHRDEICIILAGYTNEMNLLLEQNPGFKSRIQFELEFPDYNEEELYQIFELLYKEEKFKLSKGCKEIILENFNEVKKIKDFGNGRYVRNLFEKIKFEQASRIVKENSKGLYLIKLSDVKNAIAEINIYGKAKKEYGFRKSD